MQRGKRLRGWCLRLLWLAAVAGAPLAVAQGVAGTAAPPVEALVDQLRARLEREPGDVDGWVLLARSYHYLGRFDEAATASARARELGYVGELTTSAAAQPAAVPAAVPAAANIHPAVMERIETLAQPTAGSAAGQGGP